MVSNYIRNCLKICLTPLSNMKVEDVFTEIDMYVKDRNLLFLASYRERHLFIGTFWQKYFKTALLTPDRAKWSENPYLSVFLLLENTTDGCKCC